MLGSCALGADKGIRCTISQTYSDSDQLEYGNLHENLYVTPNGFVFRVVSLQLVRGVIMEIYNGLRLAHLEAIAHALIMLPYVCPVRHLELGMVRSQMCLCCRILDASFAHVRKVTSILHNHHAGTVAIARFGIRMYRTMSCESWYEGPIGRLNLTSNHSQLCNVILRRCMELSSYPNSSLIRAWRNQLVWPIIIQIGSWS